MSENKINHHFRKKNAITFSFSVTVVQMCGPALGAKYIVVAQIFEVMVLGPLWSFQVRRHAIHYVQGSIEKVCGDGRLYRSVIRRSSVFDERWL